MREWTEDVVIINFDGQLSRGYTLSATVICRLDISKFPFDKQNCSIQLASLNYNTLEVELNLTSDADISLTVD